MAVDLYIDPNSHDLVVEDGTLRLTDGVEEDAAQRMKIRLLVFQGEWILDLREGVPYYQDILTKTTAPAVDAIFKAKILEEPLVVRITQFESSINPATRGYTLDFTAELTTGETTTSTFTVGV